MRFSSAVFGLISLAGSDLLLRTIGTCLPEEYIYSILFSPPAGINENPVVVSEDAL
jgi:hypothetical protein